jgi:hypothetical protein
VFRGEGVSPGHSCWLAGPAGVAARDPLHRSCARWRRLRADCVSQPVACRHSLVLGPAGWFQKAESREAVAMARCGPAFARGSRATRPAPLRLAASGERRSSVLVPVAAPAALWPRVGGIWPLQDAAWAGAERGLEGLAATAREQP